MLLQTKLHSADKVMFREYCDVCNYALSPLVFHLMIRLENKVFAPACVMSNCTIDLRRALISVKALFSEKQTRPTDTKLSKA